MWNAINTVLPSYIAIFIRYIDSLLINKTATVPCKIMIIKLKIKKKIKYIPYSSILFKELGEKKRRKAIILLGELATFFSLLFYLNRKVCERERKLVLLTRQEILNCRIS